MIQASCSCPCRSALALSWKACEGDRNTLSPEAAALLCTWSSRDARALPALVVAVGPAAGLAVPAVPGPGEGAAAAAPAAPAPRQISRPHAHAKATVRGRLRGIISVTLES